MGCCSIDKQEVRGIISHLQFNRNDLNGFVQLFFDNSATVLALIFLILNNIWVAGKSDDAQVIANVNDYANQTVWRKIIPGLTWATLFGNIFYALMAAQVSYKTDQYGKVAALPYGVNTPAAFAFVYTVLGPAYGRASTNCVSALYPSVDSLSQCYMDAIDDSWSTGVLCNFLTGLFAAFFGIFGNFLARNIPIGVLLSGLSTVCVAFLMLNQLTGSTFGDPISGLIPLFLIFVLYTANVSSGPIPKALVIVVIGTSIAWMNGVVTGADVTDSLQYVKFYGVETGFSALSDWSKVGSYIGVVLPLAIQASASSLMNVKSASKAGDVFPLRISMIWDGCCSMVGALLGGTFPTTIYIGHPVYKKQLHATNGYSILNAVVMLLVSLTGMFALVNAIVPAVAIGPIIIFVGVMISQETLSSMPNRAAGVYVMAILPGLCDWGTQNGLSFDSMNTAYFGVIALAKSSIFFAMILGGIIYYAVNRDFLKTAIWCVIASICSAFGLIHQTTASIANYASPMGEYCVTKAQLNLGENSACPTHYAPCGDAPSLCGYIYTTRWRFLVGYLMVATVMMILWGLQRYTSLVAPVIPEFQESTDPVVEDKATTSEESFSSPASDVTYSEHRDVRRVVVGEASDRAVDAESENDSPIATSISVSNV